MLEKITRKVYHQLQATDLHGNLHDIKVLNFTASGARTGKLDRQCIVDTDTLLIPGDIITLSNNEILIISYKQADFYRSKLIRYTLDCISSTHTIDVKRTTLQKTNQGGLDSKSDVTVYSQIPVKIGLSDIIDSKVIDISTPRYIMYLSMNYNLMIGDRVSINDNSFEEAKVNSFIHLTPGLMEVTFDRDPRWL